MVGNLGGCCCDSPSSCGNGNTEEGPFSGTLAPGSLESHQITNPNKFAWMATVRFGMVEIPTGSGYISFGTQLLGADSFEVRISQTPTVRYAITMVRNGSPFPSVASVYPLIGRLFTFTVGKITSGSNFRLNMNLDWGSGGSSMQGVIPFPSSLEWCITTQLFQQSSVDVFNEYLDFRSWSL